MSDPVVTRFAPSPTGYLHVGGARTALFNWLWARHTGGTFLLRIEDTDQKRNTPTATQQVIEDLTWLGIDWDEGPQKGGPHGPYFQSERLDLYQAYVQQLLAEGKAYYCFETPEELDARRKQAEARKEGFIYRRPSNLPSEEEAAEARAAGRPVTVRFAIPQDQAILVTDLLRGEVRFEASEIADSIIRKSDGFPTYNFACVVDDFLMKVTHVIRGQEHLNNTPGQQALWTALFGDTSLPQYVHMAVTVSDSGGKLSKRERPKALLTAIKQMPQINSDGLARAGGLSTEAFESFLKKKSTPDMPSVDAMAAFLGLHLPEINVIDFRRSGYLPETLINFLALLGWNPGDDREVMGLEELIDAFTLERISKSNSLFDRNKLVAFNTEHMRRVTTETLRGHLRSYLEREGSPVQRADDAMLDRIIAMCEGARTLADIEAKLRFAFLGDDEVQYDPKSIKKVLLKGGALESLAMVRDQLARLDQFTEEALEGLLRGLAEQREVGLGKVAQPLRVAICGSNISPSIFDSVNLLGKERTLARIDNTLKRFGDQR